MTFRTWLGREIRALIAEPEIRAAPPTPSPGPTPSSPTLNGRTTPATSAEEPEAAGSAMETTAAVGAPLAGSRSSL